MSPRPGSVYRSLETDGEFIKRVIEKHAYFGTYLASKGLDDQVWECFKMQRKIVERG